MLKVVSTSPPRTHSCLGTSRPLSKWRKKQQCETESHKCWHSKASRIANRLLKHVGFASKHTTKKKNVTNLISSSVQFQGSAVIILVGLIASAGRSAKVACQLNLTPRGCHAHWWCFKANGWGRIVETEAKWRKCAFKLTSTLGRVII